jgi:hypothetical protein
MPTSAIDRLAHRLHSLIYFDSDALYVVLGMVAANMLDGFPVWISLIAPPGRGKTELMRMLLHIARVIETVCPTSETAFLSATPAREKSKDAHGGILRKIDKHGLLLINDFTSILSLSNERIAGIMAVFREAYSGYWERDVGSEGGRTLTWTGRLAVLLGCTDVIDEHHMLFNTMGERWLNYRFPEQSVRHQQMMMLDGDRPKDWQVQARDMVKDFFDEQDLEFNRSQPPRDFTEEEKLQLCELADMAARCRSAVSRDSRTRERTGSRKSEAGTRLSGSLGQLLLGMHRIGVSPPACWRILNKVALDSMPDARRQIVELVSKEPHSTRELSRLTGLCLSVARRTIEDLQVQEVVRRDKGKVRLTDWVAKNRQGFQRYLQELTRKAEELQIAGVAARNG